MRKSARWDAVLARLAKDGDLDVVTLAAELGCSPSTIRRDLRELESHHLLSRVYRAPKVNRSPRDIRRSSSSNHTERALGNSDHLSPRDYQALRIIQTLCP